MTCEEAIQALRDGKIVRRLSWKADTFISPMWRGEGRGDGPRRVACLRVPGSIRLGWYPTEEDQAAEDWEVVPFTPANRRYKPKFGSPRDFRLGLNPRWPRIFKTIAAATELSIHQASDLVIHVAQLENPRAYFNDDLFRGWADEDVVAHVLKFRQQ